MNSTGLIIQAGLLIQAEVRRLFPCKRSLLSLFR